MSKRDELQLCADHRRPTGKFIKERPHSLKGSQREEVRVRTLIKRKIGFKVQHCQCLPCDQNKMP